MKVSNFVKKLSAVGVAVGALTFGMGQAMADQIFDFSFSGPTASGFGTLTATENGDGSFTAVSGTGTETIGDLTDAINLVFNPNGKNPASSSQTFTMDGQSYVFTFDNQIFSTSDPLVNTNGLLFVNSSNTALNIFSNGKSDYTFYTSSPFNEPTSFKLTTAAAVPEPTTVAMLGLGLIGFAASRRKSAKRSA
jgi:hypothetical protein